ncbi:MAG: hypothetical protein Kow0010_15680 [Dehalococcoidia bacterium]
MPPSTPAAPPETSLGGNRLIRIALVVTLALVVLAAAAIAAVVAGEWDDDPRSRPFSARESAYTAALAREVSLLGIRLDDIGRLLARPDMDNPAWRVSLVDTADRVDALCASIRATPAPERFAEMHEQVIAAMDGYQDAMEILRQAARDRDPDALTDARAAMDAADAHLAEATRLAE